MNFMNLKKILGKLMMDNDTLRFIRHNRKMWPKDNGPKEGVVLVYYFDIPAALIAMSYFVNILAGKHHAVVQAFSSTRRGFPWDLLYWKRDKVYRSFNTQGFVRTELNALQKRRQQGLLRDILPKIKTKKDVYDLSIDGIWLGIDIYETYLRVYNRPTVEVHDPDLAKTIEQAVGILIFWQDYTNAQKVKAIVVSHDMYIYENILCKIGYQKKIPVYLPNIIGCCYAQKSYSVYDPLLKNYRAMFARLPLQEQQEGIKLAERQLLRRLTGEVGVDMPYSTKSAFSVPAPGQRVLRDSGKIKVLISSHCFYDNPHAYSPILFLDFYEWLCFLGQITLKTDYDWYIKMHPDPLPGTEAIIKGIIAKYPKITFLPPETSHLQLKKEGIDFVLTVYGSVGHELAALGMQVINAGYNPHCAYDFNWHAQSLEEYEAYLMNLAGLKREISRKDIYEFYYMHYYYMIADDLYLKSYRDYITKTPKSMDTAACAYDYFLKHLALDKHRKICQQLSDYIDSGQTYFISRGPEKEGSDLGAQQTLKAI